uniref:Uncharacterized protein n=1 Tax=viral metagenome TaxID=1070528 RepID=A0A6M3KWE7_9ZZZZ
MDNFTNERAIDLLQKTHDSVVALSTWIQEHEKMHIADAKAHLRVCEVQERELGKHSDAIRKLDIKIESVKDRMIYVSGFAAAVAGTILLLTKLKIL